MPLSAQRVAPIEEASVASQRRNRLAQLLTGEPSGQCAPGSIGV
jgi:hypothetical protein